MPPMTSRRPGAREILIGFRVRGSGFREEACLPNSEPSSFSRRERRVGTGSMKERSGGGLGGGGNFFLAFEDDAVEESAAGGGAEHGGQDVGFGFISLRKSELEGVGAAGSVPAGALVFEGGAGADPGIGDAGAARHGLGDARVGD